ncbi:MAG TPA: nuclear transport factor 2 family protein [Chryseolinea sp.]|nr:nuclear transport factor 2 family protein [Chryseolinea sp.]
MIRIVLTCVLVLNQVIGYSQTETLTPETIKQLSDEQKRMFEMFSNGDTETFLEITGDDYLAINADGTYMNKTQSVELIPKFKGSTYDILEQTDRIYGNVAISTGRAKFYLSSILVADVYFNQTWIYRDNRWQFIFWQGSMTGAPKSYLIYVTLIGTLLLGGLIVVVGRRFRRKK